MRTSLTTTTANLLTFPPPCAWKADQSRSDRSDVMKRWMKPVSFEFQSLDFDRCGFWPSTPGGFINLIRDQRSGLIDRISRARGLSSSSPRYPPGAARGRRATWNILCPLFEPSSKHAKSRLKYEGQA
jgi:hypothetical protein